MLGAQGAISLITTSDFTTAEGFAPGGGSQTLESVIINGLATTDIFLSAAPADVGGGTILFGEGSTAPATAQAALSDGRIDTGTLGTGVGDTFTFTQLSLDDHIVFFYNSSGSANFTQFPGQIQAVDSLGATVGSALSFPTTVIGDNIGGLNLDRNNAGVLPGRPILGYVIPVVDFGGDAANIAGVQILGIQGGSGDPNAGNQDFQLIAAASPVPEPSSSILVLLSASCMLRRKR